jgi:hypothetical protein
MNIIGSGPVGLMFKSTDYNFGIANNAGDYSGSASAGDMIINMNKPTHKNTKYYTYKV